MHPLSAKIYDRPEVLGHFLGYDKLTRKDGELIKWMWESKSDIYYQGHRGSYKTTKFAIVGSIWYHYFKAQDSILISRKTVTNSCDTLDEIAGHYRGPKIKELYRKTRGINDFKLRVDRKGKIVLPTKKLDTKEGSIDCAGVDSPVTGQHYPKQLDDDLATRKDRWSKAARADTRNYYDEQQNLRNPGGTIMLYGTMWHREDISHIEVDDQWVERPGLVKDPVGTLDIEGFTPEYIRQLKENMSASMYAAQYLLQMIADSERVFPDPVDGEWPEKAEPRVWLDPAYQGSHYTALTMLARYRRQWYGRGWVWRKDATEMGKEISDLLKRWNCGTLYVETNADKGWAAKEMRKHWPAVIGRNESENKHIKILTHGRKNFRKIHWAPDTQNDYMMQILDYVEGEEPDDAPDSLASLCRELKMDKEKMATLAERYA